MTETLFTEEQIGGSEFGHIPPATNPLLSSHEISAQNSNFISSDQVEMGFDNGSEIVVFASPGQAELNL